MFDPGKLYKQPAVARVAGVTTRTLANWRDAGLLPPPDAMLGARFPAWWGSTLNQAPAFTRPAEPDAA